MPGHADAARALLDALNTRDFDSARELCADSVVVEPISTDRAQRRPYVGHQGLRTYFADLQSTWAVLTVRPKEIHEQGRYVAVLGTIHARSLDGSFESEGSIGMVFRMSQELIAGIKVYADASEALAVLEGP